MLKILEEIGSKTPNYIKTRPPNRYSNYKTSIDIKPIDKDKA